jgi:hypothetical protein
VKHHRADDKCRRRRIAGVSKCDRFGTFTIPQCGDFDLKSAPTSTDRSSGATFRPSRPPMVPVQRFGPLFFISDGLLPERDHMK